MIAACILWALAFAWAQWSLRKRREATVKIPWQFFPDRNEPYIQPDKTVGVWFPPACYVVECVTDGPRGMALVTQTALTLERASEIYGRMDAHPGVLAVALARIEDGLPVVILQRGKFPQK